MEKRQLSTALATRVVNPLMRWAVRRGLAPLSYAIIETTGRRSGQRRRTPVGNVLGIDELLETLRLVRAHYNRELEFARVVVNRVERTVEHRAGLAEIAGYFGPDLVWSPVLPKRTVLQDAARLGRPTSEFRTQAGRELAAGFRNFADRIGAARVAA